MLIVVLQAHYSMAGLLLHILRASRIWLVSLLFFSSYDIILATPQCRILDQMQTFPAPRDQSPLHRHNSIGPRLLDPRDLR